MHSFENDTEINSSKIFNECSIFDLETIDMLQEIGIRWLSPAYHMQIC